MQNLSTNDSTYQSVSPGTGTSKPLFPSLCFYPRFLKVVYQSAALAKRGQYTPEVWQDYSVQVLRALESVGVEFDVRGLSI